MPSYNRIAGRMQTVLGKRFPWCQALVVDTKDFAMSLSQLFGLPIETVFISLGRQAIRAEEMDRRLAREESLKKPVSVGAVALTAM